MQEFGDRAGQAAALDSLSYAQDHLRDYIQVGEALYARVWKDAREKVFTPAQVASPLAGRPYDLRHAGVSLWLNGGVPAPEVARRAGHGVGVLLKVYAGCIDGGEYAVNTLKASRAGAPRGMIA